MTDDYDVGVIVGRFQVPELHTAHIDLIKSVCDNHDKVIIFLGLSPLMVTTNNPLDFEARKQMLLAAFPNINVLYIRDEMHDDRWSKNLDRMIEDVLTPAQKPLLYGGRDSFVRHYTGKFDTTELQQDVYVSGGEIRKEVSRRSVRSSPDFRAGVVWAAYSQFPTVYTTVDIAIFNEDYSQILLGRKENEDLYRLIGGFADPASLDFEQDARREVYEEAGIEITDPEYVTSRTVDDWRYQPEVDCIRTILFVAKHMYGTPQPGDDIHELRWFDWSQLLYDEINECHRPLLHSASNFVLPKRGK